MGDHMTSFVKAIRSEQAAFLDKYPNANHLLNVIARRSRRTKCNLNMLEIGECFVSFRSVGLTEQQYRTAKKQLQKWNLVEFKKGRRVTDKGTVAFLIDSSVYDINVDEGNGRVTEEQRKSNGRVTTNKECKKEKNEISNTDKTKTKADPVPYQKIADTYNEKLPTYRQVLKLNDKRKQKIKKFWDDDPRHQTIEFYENYFSDIPNKPFLDGRVEPTNGHRVFKADFEWLINPVNFTKVLEGKYDDV